ncbi:hypothetical protein F7C95_14260 [Opitutia bacterium ISCC 51]|nr:hypothetical protein F7C95_14260 [Opitutae bacterium ISCC 51]QXD27164.1 hypothetical protein GA003_14175 [Opitutae bacterium ISCC 52]
MDHCDLIILGGGCAGLSLGYELAQAETRGQHIPRTIIVEPRTIYHHDRTWCFWSDNTERWTDVIAKSWSRWSFSDDSETFTQQSDTWSYVSIPADRFYLSRLSIIESSPRIELRKGLSSQSINKDSYGRFTISTGEEQISCGMIVDTRPPADLQVRQSYLFQDFAGVEIELESPGFDSQTASLMDAMQVDEWGFRFDYILPRSASRALIEATRFSKHPVAKKRLAEDLADSVKRATKGMPHQVIREESGSIPMGLPYESTFIEPNWVRAGTGGNAVRPSSGYAFLRIQDWAKQCRQHLINKGTVIGHPKDSLLSRKMDELFLGVLRKHPTDSVSLFSSLASQLPPDRFARFMTGTPLLGDYLAVIRSLPAKPFIEELIHNTPFKRNNLETTTQALQP